MPTAIGDGAGSQKAEWLSDGGNTALPDFSQDPETFSLAGHLLGQHCIPPPGFAWLFRRTSAGPSVEAFEFYAAIFSGFECMGRA